MCALFAILVPLRPAACNMSRSEEEPDEQVAGYKLKILRVVPDLDKAVLANFRRRLQSSTVDGVATAKLGQWLEGRPSARAHLYEARLLGDWDHVLWLRAGARQGIWREYQVHTALASLWPRTLNFERAVGAYDEAHSATTRCLREGSPQSVVMLERLNYDDDSEVTLATAFESFVPSKAAAQNIILAVAQVLAGLAVAQSSIGFMHGALDPRSVQLLGPVRLLGQKIKCDYGRLNPPDLPWNTDETVSEMDVSLTSAVVAVVCAFGHATCDGVSPGDGDGYFCPGRDVHRFLSGVHEAYKASAWNVADMDAKVLDFSWLGDYQLEVLADGECHYVHAETGEPLTAYTALARFASHAADTRALPPGLLNVTHLQLSSTAGRKQNASKSPAPAALPANADEQVKQYVLREDAADEPAYETRIGAYRCHIEGQTYNFQVSKLSVPSTEGKRKYMLTLAHGAASFSTVRHKWACLTLGFGAYRRTKVVTIDYVCKPDPADPSQCTIVPAPTRGVLRVLVPLAVRMCQYFFPGAELFLQDAATNDLPSKLAGEDNVENRLPMSAVKLLTASSSFSTYGEYGFVALDKPQWRIDELVDSYKQLVLGKTMDILCDATMKGHAEYFGRFLFSDVIQGESRITSPANYHKTYVAHYQGMRDTILTALKKLDQHGALLRQRGLLLPDLSETIAENAKRIVRITLETPEDKNADIVEAARSAFNQLQWMFLGTFYKRLQGINWQTWESYATSHSVGNITLVQTDVVTAVPPTRVHKAIKLVYPAQVPRSPPTLKPSVRAHIDMLRTNSSPDAARKGPLNLALDAHPASSVSATAAHYEPTPEALTAPVLRIGGDGPAHAIVEPVQAAASEVGKAFEGLAAAMVPENDREPEGEKAEDAPAYMSCVAM